MQNNYYYFLLSKIKLWLSLNCSSFLSNPNACLSLCSSMTFLYQNADILGVLLRVAKSTWWSPNLILYPCFHSKLSKRDHTKYPLTSAPFLHIKLTTFFVCFTHKPKHESPWCSFFFAKKFKVGSYEFTYTLLLPLENLSNYSSTPLFWHRWMHL